MNIRELILRELTRVAFEQKKSVNSLNDGVSLIDTGLDSLCFAILVARLEDQTGADPFGANDDAHLPTTVGELISFYEDFLKNHCRAEATILSSA